MSIVDNSNMIDQSKDLSLDDDRPESSSWVRKNFNVKEMLGYGTFGQVYKVENKLKPGQFFAMKEILRGSLPKYVATEIRMLRDHGGKSNIMKIYMAYRDKERIFLVLDYFPHDPFTDIVQSTTTSEIRDYMKNLLLALDYLHKKKLIHRDIKPSNFLYNRKLKRYALIDFGLSQVYVESNMAKREVPARRNVFSTETEPSTSKENVHYKAFTNPVNGKTERRIIKPIRVLNPAPGYAQSQNLDVKKNPMLKECECLGRPQVCGICLKRQKLRVNKAGTPSFRAPEILIMSTEQTPALDIWSAGITFLSLFCRKHPIFRPNDDYEALVQLGVIFGTQNFVDFAAERGISLLFPRKHPGVDLVKFVKAMRGDHFEDYEPSCKECKNLIYGNSNATCFCSHSEENSISELHDDEKVIFHALRKCLTVHPKKRGSAQSILADLTFFEAQKVIKYYTPGADRYHLLTC